VTLVYCEKHNSVSEALKREAQVKRLSKERKERLVSDLPRFGSE
jgi:predicted GIY-YIG superfamily endonuclease